MPNLKKILNAYETHKFLYGGEMLFEKTPTLIWTVLGSCLAICFHNERMKIGAIVHAQLPGRNRRSKNNKCSERCPVKCLQEASDDSAYKYVECSINNLLQKFNNEGIKSFEINVKIFGGSSMLRSSNPSSLISIGEQNIDMALQRLEEYGLNLTSQNIGGTRGRKLYFLTDTGEVFLKHLNDKDINLNKIFFT